MNGDDIRGKSRTSNGSNNESSQPKDIQEYTPEDFGMDDFHTYIDDSLQNYFNSYLDDKRKYVEGVSSDIFHEYSNSANIPPSGKIFM